MSYQLLVDPLECRDALYDICCSRLSLGQKWILYFAVVVPLIFVFFSIALFTNPKYPEFSVEQFYVPAFNKTFNNATSSTISFDIKLHNQNSAIGLYYDAPVNVTFSFISIETNNKTIWKYSVPKFYQGNGKSRTLSDVILPLGAPDKPVFNQTVLAEHSCALPSGSMTTGFEPLVYFKVDFVTKFRFKWIWKRQAKDFALSAIVPIVATTGEKFAESGVTASVASGIGWGGTQSAVMVVLTAINLIFL